MDRFDSDVLSPELLKLLDRVAVLVKEEKFSEAENLMLRVRDLLRQGPKRRPPGWN